MSEQPQECSPIEQLNHPGLSLVTTSGVIDHRYLRPILDRPVDDRRETDSAGDKNTGWGV